ncbi:MAG: nuclear transport factor 2 family protein [Betaproteobacteria bacterium]
MTLSDSASDSGHDLEECKSLIHAFCFLIDHGQAADVVDLFCVDGVFERRGQALRGHAAIAVAMAARSPLVQTRHICSNIMLRAESPVRITGVTYFQFFRYDSQIAGEPKAPADLLEAVGEYHDVFEKTAHGWRFAHRRADAVFQRPP